MERLMNNPFVHALLLGAFALVAAALLSSGNKLTFNEIKQREAEDLQRSLQMVIPAGLHDNDPLKDTLSIKMDNGSVRKIYRATQRGRVTAVAFQLEEHGYGLIHLIMGIDASGKVLGVRVLKHEETPGLGDKIEIEKTNWITKFDGRSLANTNDKQWHVKKEGGIFDQFSGATITPKAVVSAVHKGLLFFAKHRTALLQPDNKKAEGGAGS